MNGKKFLVTAIACAAFMLGLSGTTSAADITSDFSTLQVESQDLSRHWGDSRRNYPHPHHPQPPRHHGHHEMGRGGTHHTGWGNSHKGWGNSGRRSGGSVTTISRRSTRIVVMPRM